MPASDTTSGPPEAAARVALVVGGARRVGAVVVRALAARGFAVAIHCHGALVEARALAAELAQAGHAALAVTANLRDEGPVRAMVHRVADHFGRIDVLVTTARIRRRSVLEEVTADDLRAHFDVNCVGTFVCAQEAGAVMGEQPTGGVIVFVGDDPATCPRADAVAADTVAGAIPSLARALSIEFSLRHPRVRVNAVLVEPAPPDGGASSGPVGGTGDMAAARVTDAVLSLVEDPAASGVVLASAGPPHASRPS